MELIKKTPEYKIFKKRSGRYAVQAASNGANFLSGEAKAKVLLGEGLIQPPAQKKAPAAEPEAAPAEEA